MSENIKQNQTEQTETEEIQASIEEQIAAIQEYIQTQNDSKDMGAALERLRKNPDFKLLVSEIYLATAKELLWDNIKNYEEADLLEKGSVRSGNVEKFKVELQARLILERFLKQIEEDAASAEINIPDAEAELENLIKEAAGETEAGEPNA